MYHWIEKTIKVLYTNMTRLSYAYNS